MAFLLGRLAMDSPLQWDEQVGDPMTNVGGAPVPALRAALRHSVTVPTFSSDVDTETPLVLFTIRRQLRSMLNNTPLKLAGLYLQWDDDPEQNGWYAPDQGSLTDDAANQKARATGYFILAQMVWFKLGTRRTHRRAINVYLKDKRTGLYARDTLKTVYSTDWATTPALPLIYLPAGSSDAILCTDGTPQILGTLTVGFDGGQVLIDAGQLSDTVGGYPGSIVDLAAISFEQLEASANLGDVVAYDRRNIPGLPAAGQDPQAYGWEEIYGSDFQYNWLAGQPLVNYVPDPSFRYDTLGDPPALWSAAPSYFVAASGVTLDVVDSTPGAPTGGPAMSLLSGSGGAPAQGAQIALGVLPAGAYTYSFYTMMLAGTSDYWAFAGQPNATSSILGLGTGSYGEWLRQSVAFVTDGTQVCYAGVQDRNPNASTLYTAGHMVSVGLVEYLDGDSLGWHWTGAPGQSASEQDSVLDIPVLSNGRCMASYDPTGVPGLRVQCYLGSEIGWIEQAKVFFRRTGDNGQVNLDTLVSGGVLEWAPDRCVILTVWQASGDPYARERILVTLQRGWSGPAFEYYAAPMSTADPPTSIAIAYAITGQDADINDSAAKSDNAAGTIGDAVNISTAVGFTDTPWAGVQLGASTFGEPWVSILRQSHDTLPLQPSIVPYLQASEIILTSLSDVEPDTYDTNVVVLQAAASPYNGCRVAYTAQAAGQIMEAEAMTLGAGSTVVSDSLASDREAVVSGLETDANPVITQPDWPATTGAGGTYRVFARCYAGGIPGEAHSGSPGTGYAYAKTASSTGATQTITATAYGWQDLGDIVAVNGETLEIHGWMTAGGENYAAVFDRIEAYRLQDNTDSAPMGFDGARDQGRASQFDSRYPQIVVTR
jgi:hypothetical protein